MSKAERIIIISGGSGRVADAIRQCETNSEAVTLLDEYVSSQLKINEKRISMLRNLLLSR